MVNRYSEGPVFYLRDVVFTRLAVERVSSGSPYGRERSFHIYYAGTADGRIYKVSRWRGGDDGQTGRFESKLLDVFEVTTPDPVRAITLSKRHRSLYVASDRSVQQVCHGFNLMLTLEQAHIHLSYMPIVDFILRYRWTSATCAIPTVCSASAILTVDGMARPEIANPSTTHCNKIQLEKLQVQVINISAYQLRT